jgi:type IV pilus assembly protein PilQ
MRQTQRHLKKILIFQMGLLALIFWISGCATQPSAPPTSETAAAQHVSTEPRQLQNIEVVDQEGSLDILLVGSDSMTYTAFKAIDPLRLVLDLPNTESGKVSSPVSVENELIGKVETLELPGAVGPMTRVEIGLNQESPYEIIQEQNQIRIQFEKTVPQAEAEAAEIESASMREVALPTSTMAQIDDGSTQPSPEQMPPANKITAIQPIRSGEELKVYIIGDGILDNVNVFPITDPARLVVDLMGIESAVAKATVPPSDPLVKGIRLGTHPDKVRVVFDLIPAAGLPYQVLSTGDRLVVSFKPGEGFPASPPAVAVAPAPAEPTEAVAPAPSEPAVAPEPPPMKLVEVKPASINAIDFTLLESNKSRLTVTANRTLEPEIQITGANSLSLIFPNANLPKHLQRHIDTGQFASAVNLIDPRPMRGLPGTVELHIEMREMVPYHVAQDDNEIYLDFDASTLPPPEPIELEKPVTVYEARTSVTPSPVPEAAEPAAAPEEVVPPAPPDAEVEEEAAVAEEEAVLEEDEAELLAAEEAAAAEAEEAAPPPEQVRKFTGQKISLDLQEVDIRNVLRLLADVTGKNMVVEPDVKGTVTLKVDGVPWDQVLELILKINNLDSVTEGNVIRIATAAKLKSELDRRRAEVEAKKELMAAARDLGEITTEYLQVNYADVNDISVQIDNIKSDKGTISVDGRTNLIIYSDFPRRIETAKEILARLDKATQQVMIEARIVSANTNFSRNLGISWNAAYDVNSLSSDSVSRALDLTGAVAAPVSSIGTFGIDFTRIGTNLFNLDMTLEALEEAGEGRVISSPRIFTLDHVQALIQQGDQIPYPQRTEEGTISTAFAPATLSLTVTPHITPDGKVRLEVNVKKDEADFSRTVQDVPAIRTQEAQTELLINDGDTIVIGGIVIRDTEWTEDRVPYLWRIPLLGWLFKNRQIQETKDELLIFLSPSIVAQERYTRK